MESADCVKRCKAAVADLMRSTKVFCKATGTSNEAPLEAQLKRIAPRLGDCVGAFKDEDNREQVLACLCPAGFVAAVPAKGKKKAAPAKWVVPALTDWATLYEPFEGIKELLDEVEIERISVEVEEIRR